MTAQTVLQHADITRALTRISHEILESATDDSGFVLLGIPTRGSILAVRLAEAVNEIAPGAASAGSLDVTMFRDDLSRRPVRSPSPTEIPTGGVDGRTVVLVDDVLYSGRTVRSALDALNVIGRPRFVRLAVLVDRGHRELPIRADFVGKNLPSAPDQRINVRLVETDGVDEVTIDGAEGGGAA